MSVPSVRIAKERVRNLLIADRLQCTPDTLDNLSNDIFHTMSKYIEMKPEYFQIHITRSDIHIKYTGERY